MPNFVHVESTRACDDGSTRACDDGSNPTSSTSGDNDQPQIFRFKITNEIMQLLFEFAKIHQHDDRKTYKVRKFKKKC